MELLVTLLVGAIAGWLADLMFKRFSLSLLMEILLGIVGAFVGGWLFGNALGADNGMVGRIITAFLGACIVLGIAALIKGSRRSV